MAKTNKGVKTAQTETKVNEVAITRKDARNGLTEGNKWVRSLEGASGVVKLGWGHGYQFAFKYFGIKASKNVTPETFEAKIADTLKTKDGGFQKWAKFAVLTEKGLKKQKEGKELVESDYKHANGKKVYDWELREVKSVTANALWTLCEQSLNGGVKPTAKDEARTKAKETAIANNNKKRGNK